jgi:hypothetical protein
VSVNLGWCARCTRRATGLNRDNQHLCDEHLRRDVQDRCHCCGHQDTASKTQPCGHKFCTRCIQQGHQLDCAVCDTDGSLARAMASFGRR